MNRIASVHTNQPIRQLPLTKSDGASPNSFTRKSSAVEKAAKSPTLSSPSALARELETQFPDAGRFHFRFGRINEMSARVDRLPNRLICISGPGDRVVTIKNGEIIGRYNHVIPDDISEFLNAAKNAL